MKILKNLQIKIRDIHVRFEVDEKLVAPSSEKFSFGFCLSNFEISSKPNQKKTAKSKTDDNLEDNEICTEKIITL